MVAIYHASLFLYAISIIQPVHVLKLRLQQHVMHCRFHLGLQIINAPTLNWAAALLGQRQVLLTQQVDRLVLVNLHAGAHVTVSMYKEREGAGQVFTAEKEEQMEDYSRALELQPGRKEHTSWRSLGQLDSWGLHSVFTSLVYRELQLVTEPWPGVLWKELGNTRTFDTRVYDYKFRVIY